MTGNMSYLIDYKEIDRGYVAFGGNPKGGKITRKGTKASDNTGQARKETKPVKNYILLPLWPTDPLYSQDPKSSQDDGSKPLSDDGKTVDEDSRKDSKGIDQEKEYNINSTNNVNAASTNEVNVVEADMNNLDTTIQVSPIPTTRIHKDHPLDQVIGDLTRFLCFSQHFLVLKPCSVPWPLRLSALPSYVSFTLTIIAFNNRCLPSYIVSLRTSSITLKASTNITLSLPPLNLLHSNPAVLNSGLVSRIRGSSKLIIEQQDLSLIEETQSLVELKLEVNEKHFVEQMMFDDLFETGIDVMVKRMNDWFMVMIDDVLIHCLSLFCVFVHNFHLNIPFFIMENANPPPTNNQSIERFLNDFSNQPNETNTNDLESDNESVDTPLVSPFPHSDNDSDDGEVLNELIEYENVRMLRHEKAINSFDGDDLAFQTLESKLFKNTFQTTLRGRSLLTGAMVVTQLEVLDKFPREWLGLVRHYVKQLRVIIVEMAPKRATRSTPVTENPTTTTVTNAQLQAMIDQGVTAALTARDANRNGDDSHTSGTGALTWWNSHVRIVGHDVAYAMTWIDLRKKMTDKYCPRNEIKKLETELWNLKVKGTDVTGYNQRFQELALLCVRMFPEESDKVERYVGGLPDMIHGSVVASKPKTVQEATEMATELMDKKISTFAKRQAENKRKLDNNHQAQQQLPKRQNVVQAYAERMVKKRVCWNSTLIVATYIVHVFTYNGHVHVKIRKMQEGVRSFDPDEVGTLLLLLNNQEPSLVMNVGTRSLQDVICPELKNRNHGNKLKYWNTWNGCLPLGGGEPNTDQRLNNIVR
ncbi:reverse transcriptase domain-containing protein [Tanacetum coccineum]